MLCGCAYPIPFHLYWRIVPSDPKILSLMFGEYNCVICVKHVTGEEKFEWEMLKVVVRDSMILVGRLCFDAFNGSFLGVIYLYL